MVGFYNEKDNMAALTPGYKGMKEDSDESDSEFTPLYDEDEIDQRTAQETKGWNLFREIPVKKESGSMESKDWVVSSVKFLKVLAYIVVFLVVLGSAVLSKGTLLFITSQLKKGRQNVHCNRMLPLDQQFLNTHTLEERITWLWAALIAFAIPEVGIFLRSCRICFFKTVQKPTNFLFIIAFVIETLYAIGMALLVLLILPELDVIKGAMLANAMCIVPGILNAFSRDPSDPRYTMKIMVDVISVSMQLTAFVVWPLLNSTTVLWMIPVACTFISLGWWETFVSGVGAHSPGTMVYLQDVKENLKRTRYYTQRVLTIWKILVFMVFIMLSLHIQDDDPFSFFTKTAEAFGEREYVVEEVQVLLEDVSQGVVEYAVTGESLNIPVNWSSALWVALIQVLTAYVCFGASKFACKILIQNVSFTFAHTLVVPVTVNFLIMFCGMKNADPCAFHGTIPDYLFFYMPQVNLLRQYVGGTEVAWIWLLWLISQGWICFHTWKPKCERLAATDKLFTKPWYAGVLVDQSLLFHRTKDEDVDIAIEDLKYLLRDNASIVSSDVVKDVKPSDSITRIYTCATMWHETKDEMIEFLKSVMRLDEDQSARRVAQKYLGFVDPDYYELEANIFMDDAFELAGHNSEDMQANRFVQCLVDCIDEAASEVHLTNVRLRPPKKYPTPYGGRLVWTLPGKNKLICHLKDKMKIRHRKRWSQVMYMYYFLGHRLMDLPISVDRKEVIAENTYLLALDGDIDFKPEAVTLLIDLMKKDKNLGAACGRIHPMGSGFMAWYQMFEYAIGHWLQKATEHMIGCVLCSPGCFSLFRGKALMDDNVMKRYTLTSNEARHYVQYDQGEDRWLCTLLLQRGYRVEYSAASDAFTHCPEMFDEFFNQRRRWVPSTMANIFEMLACKNIVKVNDNISTIYILYQSLLMVGTVLGPGTIFLMMIGAMNSITGISNLNALYINLIPIMIFITVCLTCKSKTQLMLAMAITCVYAMIMMLVLVGVALQIVEDGWTAPSSVFFVVTFGSFFITAALHPQEFICLLYLFIYYITIPSMYMLLIIYSLCNLNDVSWGTRETVVKKSVKELEMERKEAEEAKKKMDTQSVLKWFGINKGDETSGSMEFSIAGLFRCMCCTNPKDFKEDLHLLKIANSIEKMEKKLDSLGAIEEADVRRRSSMGLRRGSVQMPELYEDSEDNNSTDIAKEDRDDLVNPYWIEDPNLQKGEVDFLTTAEIEFWKDLIDAYLRPIDEDKAELDRIATDLKNLRNTMVFAFLMLNALFIVVIFLLQMNQDQLHFKWPLGQDITLVYDDEANIITINQDYLMLEPIGSLFLIFFGSVMLIQFTAMLFHRMGTLTHLLATCNLNWYFTKRPEEMSDDAIIEKHAVQIAKDLQRLNTDDLERRGIDEDHVTRRKTLRNLEKARESKHAAINLDANFKRRLTILQDNDPDVMLPRQSSAAGSRISNRRATLRALKNRRESVIAERRRSQLQARDSTSGLYYDLPNQSLNDMTGRPSNAGAFMIKGYEPAFDSDDDEQLPRASTVRFREHYA